MTLGRRSIDFPDALTLSLHILCPAWLFPLFPPQDTVDALLDLLDFFHLPFQCKIPLIACVPLAGQIAYSTLHAFTGR